MLQLGYSKLVVSTVYIVVTAHVIVHILLIHSYHRLGKYCQ